MNSPSVSPHPVGVRSRGFALIEVGVALALGGSLAVIVVFVFLREWRSSRLVEPTEGLTRIQSAVVEYGRAHGGLPPPSAPLTPASIPRAHAEVDPDGTWDGATWAVLHFRPVPEGVPHWFSFALEARPDGYSAHAHADMDGDGITSTFEVRGTKRGSSLDAEPGMYVHLELE